MAKEKEEWPELLPRSWDAIPDPIVCEVLLFVFVKVTHQFV